MMWRNWTLKHCWWKYKMVQLLVENGMEGPPQIKNRTTMWSSNSSSGYMDKNIESLSFPGGSVIKNPPANVGDAGDVSLIIRWGRTSGGGMATQSSILFFLINLFFYWTSPVFLPEIPWTEESGRLQSMGSQRVGRYWAHMHWKQDRKETFSHSCSQQPYSQ